jgi:cytochrome c oxidase subunit 4
MSTEHTQHIITPVRTYVAVFVALLFFTLTTVVVASHDFGFANTAIALGIACTKASLVIWFFMGVRYNTSLTKVTVAAGFIWLLIMFIFGLSDYLTRQWMGVPGR